MAIHEKPRDDNGGGSGMAGGLTEVWMNPLADWVEGNEPNLPVDMAGIDWHGRLLAAGKKRQKGRKMKLNGENGRWHSPGTLMLVWPGNTQVKSSEWRQTSRLLWRWLISGQGNSNAN